MSNIINSLSNGQSNTVIAQQQHFILCFSSPNFGEIYEHQRLEKKLKKKIIDPSFEVIRKAFADDICLLQINKKGATFSHDNLGGRFVSCETDVLHTLLGKRLPLEDLLNPETVANEFLSLYYSCRDKKNEFGFMQHSLNFSYVNVNKKNSVRIFIARGLPAGKTLPTWIGTKENGDKYFTNSYCGENRDLEVAAIGGNNDGCLGLWFGRGVEPYFYIASSADLLKPFCKKVYEFPYGHQALIDSYRKIQFKDNETGLDVELTDEFFEEQRILQEKLAISPYLRDEGCLLGNSSSLRKCKEIIHIHMPI